MTYKIFKKIALFVVVVTFISSCQSTSLSDNKTQSSPTSNLTKEQNFQIPTLDNEVSLTPTSTHLTTTIQAEKTYPPELLPTATNNLDLLHFEETITYVGWDSSPEQTFVGVFDPITSENIFIKPSEDLVGETFGGRPLWESDKEDLVFLGIDRSQNQLSFWTSDKLGKHPQQIGQNYPHFIEDKDKIAGLFSYGWANSDNWLAYAYVLSSVRRELNLLNAFTGEIIEVPMKNLYWFQWSPDSDLYAYTDLESVYIASPKAATNPDIYSWSKSLGLVKWHPLENKILVAASDNLSSKGWNSLWELDLEAGIPKLVGEFPNVTQFSYSPSGTLIALYIHHDPDAINQLVIIDSNSKEVIQTIDLPSRLFRNLEWIDEQAIAMNSGDNIYLLPTNQPDRAEWVFDSKDPFYNILPNIEIVDW